MGLLDKLKKLKNKVTGGGAEIELFLPEYCRLREPIKGSIYIKVDEYEIEVLSLKVVITYKEKIKLRVSTYNSSGSPTTKTVNKHSVLFEKEIVFDTEPFLAENSELELEFECLLPPEVLPSIEGEKSKFVWEAQAFLERDGKDNRSKSIEFHPAYQII